MKTRHLHLPSGLFALAALLLGSSAPLAARADAYSNVGVDTVQQMLAAGDVRVYDVNPRDVYEKYHLPGAVYVGHAKLEGLLPADRSTRLLFYCAGPK